MSLLHLVRHGPSAVDPAMPAHTWPLQPGAGAAVRALAASGALPARGRWFSSTEPKAVQTARILIPTSPVTQLHRVEGLREAARPVVWFDDPDEFLAVVRRSFERPDEPAYPGWEPATAPPGSECGCPTTARSTSADTRSCRPGVRR